MALHDDKTIRSGLCWDELTIDRFEDEKCIERYGYKVYSQNDEDGIIQEIFKRTGTTDKRFIEFGVQNGLECNSHYLFHKDWSGLWIEGSPKYVNEIQNLFRPVIKNGQLKVKNAFITRDNINELFSSEDFTGEIDLLSIDIDGNDWHIWKAINVINPRVVITEYNGKFPPDCEWVQAYNSNHVWEGSDWHGASLKSFELLGRELGYQLVGTNLNGCNAFFVRQDLAEDKFITPATAEILYNPLRGGLKFTATHPARYCLKGQQEELGIKNYYLNGGSNKKSWARTRNVIYKIFQKIGRAMRS